MIETTSSPAERTDPAVDFAPPGIDDATLRAAVAVANIPTLLMLLVQLTGDLRWLEEPFVLSRTKGMADNDTGGLPEELQEEVRQAAADAIVAWRHGRPTAIPTPSGELMVRMLSVSMADAVPPEYGEVLVEDLAVAVGTSNQEVNVARVPAGFSAMVIGAGISGVAAAIKLRSLGIPYVVVESGEDVGGVWRENSYPGAAVDTPSHLYSYSFAPNAWSRYFAARDEILAYVRRVADEYDVHRHVRFGTTVRRAEWDEHSQRWNVRVGTADGRDEVLHASVLLSCVGAFNPPAVPDIPGLDSFAGPRFHTAQWPKGLDIRAKKVAVVGSGASAMQVVPAIAPEVAKLTVFQRSPQWAQPFEKFQQPIPASVQVLFDAVPLYRAWYKLRLSWIYNDKLYKTLQRDPAWTHPTTINATNERHRKYFTDYIRSELVGREDLLPRTVPNYPPFGKRMLQDNGWFRTLKRDNVELVVDTISKIQPHGIATSNGSFHEADILVFATGFDVVRFISSFQVRGRDGRDLRTVWEDDDCRAYMGLTVPGFPNFFTLYGPNTQSGHGGSLIHTVENQLNYIGSMLTQMFDAGIATVEVKEQVYDDFAAKVDKMHQNMIWSHPAMTTYYRNARGRVVAINPFRNVDYWHMTRHANLAEYHTELVRGGDSQSPVHGANGGVGSAPHAAGAER
jgi:4-hydroxyacetophenone monooxygenase